MAHSPGRSNDAHVMVGKGLPPVVSIAIRRLVFAITFGCLCGSPLSAYALKTDRQAPANLAADRVDIDEVKRISTYSGAVHLSQGSLNLWADVVVVKRDKKGIRMLDARGQPARLTLRFDGDKDDARLRAANIRYFPADGHIELTGEAYMWREGDEFSGYSIRYDESDDKVIAHSDATGKGRVKAIIQPQPQAEE